MPRYEVRELDVWGNAVDGYEVNNSFRLGEVMLPDPGEDALLIVKRLVDAGYLDKNALSMARNDELGIDDEFEIVTITEQDTAWAAVLNDDQPGYGQADHYIDAASRRDAEEQIDPETEHVEEAVGERPVLQLSMIEGREGAVPFLRKQVRDAKGLSDAVLELRVDPEELVFERKNKRPDFKIDSYVDGDYFGTFSLTEIDGETIGVSRAGADVVGDADLVSMAHVAMDAFLERGGEGHPTFVPPQEAPRRGNKYIAQNYGPQSGYAYVLSLPKRGVWNWNEAEPEWWETEVVGRDDFGEEVGVIVLDGVEMRVWRAV